MRTNLKAVPEKKPNEDIIEYVPQRNLPPASVYTLIVKGESMNPGLRPGDYIAFMQASSYKHNDIVIVSDEFGDCMLKRYKIKDNDIILTSDNPEYPTIKPNDNYRILGKVIKAWRDLPF